MNKNYIHILFFTSCSFFFAGCEHDEALPNYSVADTLIGPPPPNFPANNNQKRIVLVEEMVGHSCLNSPGGTAYIRDIMVPSFADSMIAVSVHMGGISVAEPNSSNPEDLTAIESDTFGTFSGWSYPGYLPVALINRKNFNGEKFLSQPQWYDAVSGETQLPLQINLQIINQFDVMTNTYYTFIESDFEINMSGDFKMVLYVVEDSVYASQINNIPPAGDGNYASGNINNYYHRNILRKIVDGFWGQNVISGNISAGNTYINTFSFEPDPSWNISNLSVVAFVYNNNTVTREVIQAVKKDL